MTAREAALSVLEGFRRRGAWPDIALDHLIRRERLEPRDAALAQTLCLGVLQNRALLDFFVDAYSSVKTRKLEPKVLDILRLSVYQLAFLDKIPSSAAVSEGTELCKKMSPRAAALVNAVLRRVSENRHSLPEPPGQGGADYLAVKYSHPLWIVRELTARLGYEAAAEVLRLDNSPAPLAVQVNTLKTTAFELLESLAARGLRGRAHAAVPDCLLFDRPGDVTALPEFRRGAFYIQDPAAKLAALAGDARPGQRVLDLCAAPGGKSFAMAVAMGNTGEILACDIHENKLRKIEEGAARLSIDIIQTRVQDAGAPEPDLLGRFDLVLADAPCSGLGVIRKKPEIRYRAEAEIQNLPRAQLRILKGAARCVRPGGTLVYATCTWREAENGDVVRAFLRETPAFSLDASALQLPAASYPLPRTFWPHADDTDGFFLCKMKRRT